MSDERGWYRSGEGEPETGEDRSEAYRAWQRQQQLQRPWDRQQPWQQESAPEPPHADQWSRSGSHQQLPDGAGPDMVPNGDDFRPPYRREQQNPAPPMPNPPVPQAPRPARPQPVPPPFQPQYAPPRPDAPPLPVRGRHGGPHDSQELPRLPRAEQELPRLPRGDFAGPAGAGPGAGPPEPGRRGGPPTGEFNRPPTGEFNRPQTGEFGGPPTGGNLPRISDPARRGPDMYSNEPPRPGPPRHDGGGTATEQFRPDRTGAGSSRAGAPRPDSSRNESGPSRAEPGRAGRDADGRGIDGRSPDGRGTDNRSSESRSTDGRGSRGIGGGDDTGPRGRGTYGVPGAGHGRSKPSGGNGGGNRGLLIVGTTVGVIALALIAYFATRPSGHSNSGATADATSSSTQGAPIPSGPASGAASGTPTATGSAGAGPAGSPSASASSTPSSSAAAVNKAQVHVQVFNGSGVNQRAAGIKSALVTDGFTLATVAGTDPKTTTTKVYYPATRADSAAAVAQALAIPSADLSESQMYPEVTVVIGTDWSTGNTYPAH